jgi:hypothetical protein
MLKKDAKIHLTEMYKVVKVDLCRAAIGIWDITSLALAR